VVVVGAGGAGLRATLGLARGRTEDGQHQPRSSRRASHTVAAQGGISAALGQHGAADWRWHMYGTPMNSTSVTATGGGACDPGYRRISALIRAHLQSRRENTSHSDNGISASADTQLHPEVMHALLWRNPGQASAAQGDRRF